MRPTRFIPAAGLAVLALLAATVPAAAQVAPDCPRTPPAQATFRNPDSIGARSGILIATLTADTAWVRVGACRYVRNVYNGSFVPPTLRLKPGNAVNVRLVNQIARTDTTIYPQNWTNLHYHGFNVTPDVARGDQVVNAVVDSGSVRQFLFQLPRWHPEGLFWYHPHPHGISDGQVQGGMAGAIVVGDLLRHYPEFRGAREQVMLFKDFNQPGRTLLTLNGDSVPNVPADAYRDQFWRMGNLAGDTYLRLKLLNAAGDSMPFVVVAVDGNRRVVPDTAYSLLMTPATRVEAIVNLAPARGGYTLITDTINGGARATLATVSVAGTGTAPTRTFTRDAALADSIRALWSLPASGIKQDTFVFRSPGTGQSAFTINGDTFKVNTLNRAVPLGSVQDWTLVNDTTGFDEHHVFHIHQLDFLVLDDGTGRPDTLGLRDVIDLPPGRTVRVRIPFTQPLIQGLFVYHCHVLFHEDHGMMQSICVYDPERGPQSCPTPGAHGAPAPAEGGGHTHGHGTHGAAAPAPRPGGHGGH